MIFENSYWKYLVILYIFFLSIFISLEKKNKKQEGKFSIAIKKKFHVAKKNKSTAKLETLTCIRYQGNQFHRSNLIERNRLR